MAKSKSPDVFQVMAEKYGVADNALFCSTLDTYRVQFNVISSIETAITESGDPTVSKEYVKGRENLYIHPAVRELPKHADSLGKTAALLLNIIKELGDETYGGDDFERF